MAQIGYFVEKHETPLSIHTKEDAFRTKCSHRGHSSLCAQEVDFLLPSGVALKGRKQSKPSLCPMCLYAQGTTFRGKPPGAEVRVDSDSPLPEKPSPETTRWDSPWPQAQGPSGLRDRRPKEEERSREKRERAWHPSLGLVQLFSDFGVSEPPYTYHYCGTQRAFGYVGFIYQYHIRNSNWEIYGICNHLKVIIANSKHK